MLTSFKDDYVQMWVLWSSEKLLPAHNDDAMYPIVCVSFSTPVYYFCRRYTCVFEKTAEPTARH